MWGNSLRCIVGRLMILWYVFLFVFFVCRGNSRCFGRHSHTRDTNVRFPCLATVAYVVFQDILKDGVQGVNIFWDGEGNGILGSECIQPGRCKSIQCSMFASRLCSPAADRFAVCNWRQGKATGMVVFIFPSHGHD